MDKRNNEVRPEDYFEEIDRLTKHSPDREARTCIYSLLQGVCCALTRDMSFSNLFSRLDFVCRNFHVSHQMQHEIQNLRHLLYNHEDSDFQQHYPNYLSLLAEFVSCVLGAEVPQKLKMSLPRHLKDFHGEQPKAFYKVLRILTTHFDDHFIYGVKDSAETNGDEIRIDYLNGGYDGDLLYLKDLLRPQMPLNLIKAKISENGDYLPQEIILLPDYLLDVSTLASCFEKQGHEPANFLLHRFAPHEDNTYSMLGNVASQFLDDLIFEAPSHPATYATSLKKAFSNYPISFALLDMNGNFDFHAEAKNQFGNLKRLIEDELEQKYHFDKEKALVEPSFVCEPLGMAGRMDYLQHDGRKLIEQKSGKRDEYRKSHQEPHFIQMMLYQSILEFCLNVPATHTEPYLLYSRYDNGLMLEKSYNKLLRETFKLRNRIVMQELACAEGRVEDFIKGLTPQKLNTANLSNVLWQRYISPRLQKLLLPFQPKADPDDMLWQELLLHYFYRFHAFLCREQMLGKTGMTTDISHSFSDLWNLPANLRSENGDMLANLYLQKVESSNTGPENKQPEFENGMDLVFLGLPDSDTAPNSSNFRLGDAVLVYSYDKSAEPDVRKHIVLRGVLCEIHQSHLVVKLTHGQRNLSIFNFHTPYALEHDHIESSSTSLFRGLYEFLVAPKEYQALLLSQRPPRFSKEQPLKGDYPGFNNLVKKEKSAQDYFLVIGPPGSGKTSCALRYMVEEELRCGTPKILLLAYTHRAVDELCSMLENIIKDTPQLLNDYLRLGSELSAAPSLRNRLLSVRASNMEKAADVRAALDSANIIVATTTTLSSQDLLLRTYKFDVAFVDEASQILEPALLKILSTSVNGETTVRRFVLVGDQKQLPAVVQQSPKDSEVNDPLLRQIGLTDCRNSLFQRLLLSQGPKQEASFLLTKQGRMHPALFHFVNEHFYNNALLCIPLPHQSAPITNLFPHTNGTLSPLARWMASHRICFIDCKPNDDGVNDKINSAEALLTARLLQAYHELLEQEGTPFQPQSAGVIVPYRNQITMIRSQLETLGEDLPELSIDTIERYQGSQRDFIVYPFTIRRPYQLNFLAASSYTEHFPHPCEVDRKLNVALTRARNQMFIIGNAPLLKRNPVYAALIQSFQEQHDFFISKDLPF